MVDCQNEHCYICGAQIPHCADKEISVREIQCLECGSPKRSRDLAQIVLHQFAGEGTWSLKDSLSYFEEITIYEAQAHGPVHDLLSLLPNYYCSEFFDDVEPGRMDDRGIRCENLEELTFEDDFFDLVITQDVFEHVKNPFKGFFELHRVLKPSGRHIFTVPVHEGRKTRQRDPGLPVYHGDPLREEGSYVYTDFGMDLPELLGSMGISTRIALHEKCYSEDRIPFIHSDEEYKRYMANRSADRMLKYFLYNSLVFMSGKEVEPLVSTPPEYAGNRVSRFSRHIKQAVLKILG